MHYYKIIPHRAATHEELEFVLDMVATGLLFGDTGSLEPQPAPAMGYDYHIGFPPDDERTQAFADADDGHMIMAIGYITSAEFIGRRQLFGWGHDHKIILSEVLQ